MKNLFSTNINVKSLDFILLLLRIAVAAFMLTHGYPKLMKLLAGGEIRFADPFGLGMTFSLVLAVFAEFFCSILHAFGIGTRLAAIPLIITMSVAAFIAHGSDPFGKKELALLYLVIYVFFLFAGSGKFSVDYLISRKLK
jgi:putative oxidoreductase